MIDVLRWGLIYVWLFWAVTGAGVALLVVGLIGAGVARVRAASRRVDELIEDALAPLPVSDEDLLDVADVVGVRR